ncbi:uncharacterized protein UBRO2_00313 [Ustilago bromivora]|uniref:Uncharacterized protein n=1 Tax=Ustilago bromivora TaxID=307758 RepID=A0A8H8QGP6_9BASI|nr:uncharacterized protein UBRO2_00313 [Ustilago bromivora]
MLSNDSILSRATGVPPRLRISKQPVKGPLLAPATITADSLQASASQQGNTREPSFAEPQFVFPPRTSVQKRWPHDESHPHVRSFISLDGQYDDDEPTLDIIPSPSRRRKFPLPTSSVPPGFSAHAIFSFGCVSCDSTDSTYSHDSLSGHPFSLQFPGGDERDLRASSTGSMFELDELDNFRSPFIDRGVSTAGFMNAPTDVDEVQAEVGVSSATSTIVPAHHGYSTATLILSNSRPYSSSSSTTLTPSAAVVPSTNSMRVNDETAFPLPPFTSAATDVPFSRTMVFGDSDGFLSKKTPVATTTSVTTSESPSAFSKLKLFKTRTSPAPAPVVTSTPTQTLDLGSESGADQSLAIADIKREAQALLESIRTLSEEIDTSIPPTHHLPGSIYKRPNGTKSTSPATSLEAEVEGEGQKEVSFVAVDMAYLDVWRLMDSWYWSSFEVGPAPSV